MQDRGLAAYIAELIGTFLLVFFITSVVVLFAATGDTPQFGSDFAVIGFVQGLTLFGVIMMFGVVSGGHFNPAVTFAVALVRKIDPIDAVVFILAQLSGAVLGALATKWLLTDEGRATNYGTPAVSNLLGSPGQGAFVEFIGTFCLIMVILAAVHSTKSTKDWAPLAIGTTFVFVVMVAGPLTGASMNPARYFGPALVSGEFGGFAGIWPYLAGPFAASLAAVGVFKFVVEAGAAAPTEPPTRVKPAAAPKRPAAAKADPKPADKADAKPADKAGDDPKKP